MPRAPVFANPLVIVMLGLVLPACSQRALQHHAALGPRERFDWIAQPIEFSPPPSEWYRQGDNGGGLLGVRFILTNGGGQVMSVAAYRQWAEHLPRQRIVDLLGDLDSLDQRGTLQKLGMIRVQLTEPLTDGESRAAEAVNRAVDRAEYDLQNDRVWFVRGDLTDALRSIDDFRPTLADLLPRMKLDPGRQQEPERWVLGFGVDTTIAGLPAYVSNDTLNAPEQKLLYRQVYWVVNGCAFQAIYQGRPANQAVFEELVETVRFPGSEVAAH